MKNVAYDTCLFMRLKQEIMQETSREMCQANLFSCFSFKSTNLLSISAMDVGLTGIIDFWTAEMI